MVTVVVGKTRRFGVSDLKYKLLLQTLMQQCSRDWKVQLLAPSVGLDLPAPVRLHDVLPWPIGRSHLPPPQPTPCPRLRDHGLACARALPYTFSRVEVGGCSALSAALPSALGGGTGLITHHHLAGIAAGSGDCDAAILPSLCTLAGAATPATNPAAPPAAVSATAASSAA